jgi:hypothetical protein
MITNFQSVISRFHCPLVKGYRVFLKIPGTVYLFLISGIDTGRSVLGTYLVRLMPVPLLKYSPYGTYTGTGTVLIAFSLVF